MKIKLFSASLAILMALPVVTQAKPITFTAQLNNYQGDGAYLAIYLTDADGVYQRTLWIAGGKSKHYKYLTDWALGSKMNPAEYDGLTGASISSGKTLNVTVNIDDSLIDQGYQLRVDSAVEDVSENSADIITPFTSVGVGKVAKGKGVVKSFKYDL